MCCSPVALAVSPQVMVNTKGRSIPSASLKRADDPNTSELLKR